MRSKIAVSIALLALSLTGCAGSDGDTPPADAGSAAEMGSAPVPRMPGGSGMPGGENEPATLLAEYQEIQQRLGQAQQQAMADETLQAAYTTLQGRVDAHMLTADPEFREKQTRLQTLGQNLAAARQAGDTDAIQSITAEGNALQAGLQQLQSNAFADEAIAAELTGFQEKVETRMAEIDPTTPALLARVAEIGAILQGGPAGAGADATAE